MNPERRQLVENNLGLVHACVRRYIGRGEEYDDMYQTGCIGLIKAANSYNPSRGTAFSTYAVPVILGEIRAIFRDGGSIKVSRIIKELGMRIQRCRTELDDSLGRSAQISEIAAYLGESCEAVADAICAMQPPVSLSAGDNGDTQTDIPVDNQDVLFDKLALKLSLSCLSHEERRLITLRYTRCLSQTQTAAIMGISQVGVSRREKKILKKLRGY